MERGSGAILSLASVGCEGQRDPVTAVLPVQNVGRVEYRRPAVTEWYARGARGVEQGFTLERSPCGESDVELVVRVDGFEPRESRGGAAVDLVDARGVMQFHYTDLVVRDALGASLPASLRAENGRIVLRAATRGAKFPIVIDPELWTEQGMALARSDGAANDAFGLSVSLSGASALIGASIKTVGANASQGAAYVFTRRGSAWSPEAQLIPADGAASDNFGLSVSIAVDTALVGANMKTIAGQLQQGAAYVFVGSGSAWTQQGGALSASDGKAQDHFGTAVAISGDTAIVGAATKTVGVKTAQGAAYVFVRSRGIWTQQGPALAASDAAASDKFGASVAISGDTVVVGASFKNGGQNPRQGAAYVFVRSGVTWSQQGLPLRASDGVSDDQFGNAVSISGDTLVVGAFNKGVMINTVQGAAYVFVRTGTKWARQGVALKSSDAALNSGFGSSVSVFGDTIAIGSSTRSPGSDRSNQGGAYIFVRAGATWTQQGNVLLATDSAAQDALGYAVSTSGDFALLGAPTKTVGANKVQGAAYVFARPCVAASECAAGALCVAGLCTQKQARGQACSTTSDCASDVCADGVCCESACSSPCQACAELGEEGQCVPVTGAPRMGHAACSTAPDACNGSCDGVVVARCGYPTSCDPTEPCDGSDCLSNAGSDSGGSSGDSASGGAVALAGGGGAAAGRSGAEGDPTRSGAAGAIAAAGAGSHGGAADRGTAGNDSADAAGGSDEGAGHPAAVGGGCSCRFGCRAPASAAPLALLLTFGLMLGRRRFAQRAGD